jgi:hypothetical protein
MAGLGAILRALGRAVWRDLRTCHSITANNFFLFAVLVAYQQVESALFFTLVMGLLLLFPLSADPLSKVPRERLESWPLEARRRVALRLASIALSPAGWITVALVAKTARPLVGLGFLLLAVVIQSLTVLGARLAARAPGFDLRRRIPRLPGVLGSLIRKDLRQILTTLDFYVAMLVSLAGIAYRLADPGADREAFPILAAVVVLALSTYGQCLFGLDLPSGWDRYRLLPLGGWFILLAKGITVLLVMLALTLPLEPNAGAAAGLAALAVGHHASVRSRVPQSRWRFTGGTLFPTGLVQVVCIFGAGMGGHRQPLVWLPAAGASYAASLWYYGKVLSDPRT